MRFLEVRVSGLLAELSDGRRCGRIGLRHERFAYDRPSSVLHGLRSSFAPRVGARRVVLATLAEVQSLQVEMSALVLAAAGCRVVTLGADCPVGEVAVAVRESSADAVVIDVAKATPVVSGRLRRLRERIDRAAPLVVTGADARAVSRCLVLAEPSRLYEWAVRAA